MGLTLTRPFVIDIGYAETSPEWASLREVPLKVLQGCSFGAAEEVIGLLEYEDGLFVVGIGECLRPFIQLYEGRDVEQASDAFARAIIERAYEGWEI